MTSFEKKTPAQEAAQRVSETKIVTIVGSIVNIFLTIVKMAAGLVSGSSAILADAFHSLSDLVTDLMVYVSISIAAKEADEDHPYGHGRAETIAAAAIGVILVLMGLTLVMDVGQKLMHGEVAIPTWPALVAAIISVVANEALFRYTLIKGKQHNNQAIIANAWHHRTDSISSVAALLGVFGAMMGYPLLDPLAAIVVVFMIAKAGGEITWKAMQDLMDASLSEEKMKELGEVIMKTEGVKSFHELRARALGGDFFVDAHIEVQPDISVSEAHNIAETVRHNLKKAAGATDALVHIDAEDDMQYKIIRQNRAEVEGLIAKHIGQTEEAKGFSQVVIHYLKGKTMVDLTLELDGRITMEKASQVAEGLKKRLEDGKLIHHAVIKGKLTEENNIT